MAGQTQAGVIHGDEEAFDSQLRIEACLHNAHCVEELAKTFEGEVFALDRDDDRVGCGKSVDRNKAERGTAVDYDKVVVVLDGVEGALDEVLPVLLVHQFHLGTHQVDTCGEYGEIGGVGLDKAVMNVCMPHETLIGTFLQLIGVDAQTR